MRPEIGRLPSTPINSRESPGGPGAERLPNSHDSRRESGVGSRVATAPTPELFTDSGSRESELGVGSRSRKSGVDETPAEKWKRIEADINAQLERNRVERERRRARSSTRTRR